MVPASNLLAFVAAAVALIALPGPSVLFVIGRSLAYGRRGGLLSVLGNAIGCLPPIFAVALGVGAIVAESVVAFTIVKLVGAGYIVYLGIQAIRHRNDISPTSGGTTPAAVSTVRLLREGFVVGLTNPKLIVFAVAVLPQFVDYPAGSVAAQLLVLGLVFVGVAVCGDSLWALAAGTARDWFARSPRRMSRLRAGGGVMMVGLGGTLAFTGAKS